MTRSTRFAALAVLAALAGCVPPEVDSRLDAIEAKLKEHDEKIASGGGGGAAAAANANAGAEQAAMELYKQANQAFQTGNTDEARSKLVQLQQEHGGTRVASAAQRLLDQINVVGKEIADLNVEEWYQGKTSLAEGDATLVVFWEIWCPHCRREVPKLQATYEKYKGEGLNMVGLTKLSRNKTAAEIKDFISENNLTYPMAKETGDMSDFFGVSGVPAAAVVKDGKVVWRGHPAQLSDEQLKGWL